MYTVVFPRGVQSILPALTAMVLKQIAGASRLLASSSKTWKRSESLLMQGSRLFKVPASIQIMITLFFI